jgi:hypothetical protein
LDKVTFYVCFQILSNIEGNEMTASITRRSAGLPIIVQTIVQAEKQNKSVSGWLA